MCIRDSPIIPKEYQGSNIKKAKITGAKYKNTSYTPTSYFELKGVEIKNIEKSSTLLIPRGQLPSSTLDNITKSITEGVENVDITFYTYEKPVYVSDTSEALTVNILSLIHISCRGIWSLPYPHTVTYRLRCLISPLRHRRT